MFVNAVSAGTERDYQEQSTGNRQSLEEVILDKVAAEYVRRHHPPRVEVDIDGKQPRDENQRRQPRLVADGDQHDLAYKYKQPQLQQVYEH